MKRSKFSEAQIVFILRQADEGTPGAEVAIGSHVKTSSINQLSVESDVLIE